MLGKNFLDSKGQQAVSYTTPSTETYNMSVQGVLCGSFDQNNFTENLDREEWEEL